MWVEITHLSVPSDHLIDIYLLTNDATADRAWLYGHQIFRNLSVKLYYWSICVEIEMTWNIVCQFIGPLSSLSDVPGMRGWTGLTEAGTRFKYVQ